VSTRISFFDVGNLGKVGVQTFLKGMASEKFSATQAAGFLLTRQSSQQVEGRYVQKIVAVESFDDPFGKKYSYERTVYTEQKFILRLESPNLVLFDSNSAGKALMGRLSEFSGFRVALKPLNWAPEELLVSFAKRFAPVRVFAATVDGLKLSPSVTVRLCFESSDDVLTHVRSFLKKKTTAFESLKIEFSYLASTWRCELRRNGSIQIYGDFDPSITSAVLELVHRHVVRTVIKTPA